MAARNDAYNWNKTLNAALSQHPEIKFLVSPGDQINEPAAGGEAAKIQLQEVQYAGYLSAAALGNLPEATCIGNHDSMTSGYSNHFNVPNPFVEETSPTVAGHVQYLAEPVLISANKDWLQQILVNLTENALKYTPEDGDIELSYACDDRFAVFTVHNTGEGINEEENKKIFERFYRVEKARTRRAGGTGLGLSIVKFIVEMFGGTIRVVSKPGQGVSFIFTIPRANGETLLR